MLGNMNESCMQNNMPFFMHLLTCMTPVTSPSLGAADHDKSQGALLLYMWQIKFKSWPWSLDVQCHVILCYTHQGEGYTFSQRVPGLRECVPFPLLGTTYGFGEVH